VTTDGDAQADRLAELVPRLRARGYRLTPQRLAILEVLAASRGHPSAELVHQRVRVRFPTISLGTVYKTVELLREMGEVLELGFTDGSTRYDGRRPRPHPHLVCRSCGAITDLDLEETRTLPDRVAAMHGWSITSHRLDFFGLCPRCLAAGAGDTSLDPNEQGGPTWQR